MPELPEVETVVSDLRPRLRGRRFTSVEASPHRLRKPWVSTWGPILVGQRIREVSRRGKWILVRLERGQHLVIHLGMSGQLTVVPATEPLGDHTHLVFGLDREGRQLRFRDIRRFGSATLFADAAEVEQFFTAAGLGPEPWDLKPESWRFHLARTARCLKAVLLDQRVVAGVGNIYADESLFTARLHPARVGKDLRRGEAERLRQAILAVLDRAIEKRGSSIRNYVGGSGLRGEYQNEFRVYGQTGAPCPRCGRPIACLRLGGRSSHFCPRCQRPPRREK